MLRMEFPQKKISRIKNPHQSSEVLSNNMSEQHNQYDSPSYYDERKFPKIFQFNDRSKVSLSGSEYQSSVNNLNESGQNIFNFSSPKYQEKVLQIDHVDQLQSQNPSHIEKFNQKAEKQKTSQQNELKFSFNPKKQFSSPQSTYLKNINNYEASTNAQNIRMKKSKQQQTPNSTLNISYHAPQVKMFQLNRSVQEIRKSESKEINQDSFSFLDNNLSKLKPQDTKQKDMKKTFKPMFLNQCQAEQEVEDEQVNQNKQKENCRKQQISSKIQAPESYRYKSIVPKSSQSLMKQQIQDQNIQTLIKPQVSSKIIKEKQKANILQQDKLSLSEGSVHSQTQKIIQNLRDQSGHMDQQLQLNFQSRQSEERRKQMNETKNMVESKLIDEKSHHIEQTAFSSTKITKKPRKKIFQDKTYQSEYQPNFHKKQKNCVSQYQRSIQQTQRDPSPSQCLMKSLEIIDKLAVQKQRLKEKQQKSQEKRQRLVIIPPAPLTITQSPGSNVNLYSQNSEQIQLRQQILELNFQKLSFQSTFQLEKFDSNASIESVNQMSESSKKLFQNYKLMILKNSKSMQFSSQSYNALKQQILNLHESTTHIFNLQQKYLQVKYILNSFQMEIKDILLLNSKEKYKKIRLLAEAIEVMEKMETYLSLESGKIDVLIRTFVKKQKILLEELRDWLKECLKKQYQLQQANSIEM